jgi:hypothetical protein
MKLKESWNQGYCLNSLHKRQFLKNIIVSFRNPSTCIIPHLPGEGPQILSRSQWALPDLNRERQI